MNCTRLNSIRKLQLKKIGIKCLCVSRFPNEQQLNYDQLNDLVLKHHLLIVNTTPLGTTPNINECPDYHLVEGGPSCIFGDDIILR